jgi:PAS domain S-box-containing protein
MEREPDNAGDSVPSRSWPSLSAEDRFARVVDAAPTALVLAGAMGRIEMVNRRAEQMFGYDRSELFDSALEVLVPERFRLGHVALRDHFLSDMSARAMGAGRDLYGLRKDGSEFPLEIGLNPIELDGKVMVLAGIIDISGRRRIELEKEQQRIELARSNADLEEFAYVASHDLKAPLRAISHLVEWIDEDVSPTASTETMDNLKLLRGRVVRLQMLLDGLLSYARIGRVKVSFEKVDIEEVVQDIVAVLSPPDGFVVECARPMPMLRTHRTPILVVLQNLIANGLKHHDGAEGRITIAMKLENGVAEFRVSDDGPGIEPRFHDKIFVIFQTLASRDDVETSGIGLAIVKKRVEGHGGRIWVESAPPKRGTTIAFTWKEPIA